MKKWSDIDISRLCALYLSKASIEEMALVLRRTPTAINKALGRSGVRIANKKKPELRQRRYKSELEKWISMGELVHFLKKYGITKNTNTINLLIHINKLREEQKLPPFFVKGITK